LPIANYKQKIEIKEVSILTSDILDLFQIKIGYKFKNKKLLKTALAHKSYLSEKTKDSEIIENNERLEFLGDAVVELITTEYLYMKFPNDEGYLTALRSSLVNYKIMGEVGNELGMDEIILLSRGEKEELGKARLTIVADALEAILGAMYLDGGYEPCRDFVRKFLLIKLPEIIDQKTYKDEKTRLQEFSQRKFKVTPNYQILSSEGLDHNKVFRAGVYLEKKLIGEGEGKSKQEAHTAAAFKALKTFEEDKENEQILNIDLAET
jgi:ribonuclease III